MLSKFFFIKPHGTEVIVRRYDMYIIYIFFKMLKKLCRIFLNVFIYNKIKLGETIRLIFHNYIIKCLFNYTL